MVLRNSVVAGIHRGVKSLGIFVCEVESHEGETLGLAVLAHEVQELDGAGEASLRDEGYFFARLE